MTSNLQEFDQRKVCLFVFCFCFFWGGEEGRLILVQFQYFWAGYRNIYKIFLFSKTIKTHSEKVLRVNFCFWNEVYIIAPFSFYLFDLSLNDKALNSILENLVSFFQNHSLLALQLLPLFSKKYKMKLLASLC